MKRSQVSNGRKFQYLAMAINEVERREDGVWKTDIIGLACQYSFNPKLKREDFEAILNTPIINIIEQVTKDKNIVKRVYDKDIDNDFGDLMTVEVWEECVAGGCFCNYDGSGYWIKNGKASRDEVFSTPKLDATHVIWYNK